MHESRLRSQPWAPVWLAAAQLSLLAGGCISIDLPAGRPGPLVESVVEGKGRAKILLVEIEAFSEARAQDAIEEIGEALLEAGAEDVELAKREKVWAVRHAVAEAIKHQPAYSAVDACVPRRSMPDVRL